MAPWLWALVAVAALYGLFVLGLVLAGRRLAAGAVARFLPDCVVLVRRLERDGRLPRRHRLLLLGLLGYLLLPFDLVPDFIPVAGVLDDAIVVALVLRVVLRAAGPDAIAEHWPGPESSLRAILRLVN